MPPIVRKSVTGRVRVNPRSLLLDLLLAATVVGASTRVAADDRGGNLAAALKGHVRALTGTAEPRNYQEMESLNAAAGYIEGQLKACGLTPVKQEFEAGRLTNYPSFSRLPDRPQDLQDFFSIPTFPDGNGGRPYGKDHVLLIPALA